MTRFSTILLCAAPLCVMLPGLAVPALARPAAMAGGGDWFEPADANGDGVVTREEFLRHRAGNFDKLDRNHDGVVSPADYPRLAKLKPEAYQRLTAMLDQADRNGDGAVSRAEMAETPPLMFTLADADQDGRVTRAEYDAARQTLRDRRK